MVKLAKKDQEQLEKAQDLMPDDDQAMGFARSLFYGRLRLDQILPYPTQDAEQARKTAEMLRKVDAFMNEHVDAEWIDDHAEIPQHVIDGLGELGVLGMTVPAAHGGGGFKHTGYCKVLERIAKTCGSTAVLIGAHQSIGIKALVLNGTDEQKSAFLPDLAAGRKIGAFALTEPEAGSDAANVQTEAVLSEDGSHWVLNGGKRYITNGGIAGMMTVMARTRVNGKDKVSAFLVTPDLPGFEVVEKDRAKCGIRGTWQATLKFTDMKVPVDRVLGEPGRGLRVALTVLDYGRCTLSAGCLGGAKLALDMTLDHVRQRRQFDRHLMEFDLVKKKVAAMSELVFAMDAMTYMCAGMVDRHADDVMLETAMCKLFCSEAGWRVIDDAVQLHGGLGYMKDYGLERMLRDARINRIVEGATEVMTSFVALMGMKNVGEEFEEVLNAAKNPVRNFGRLAQFARHEWSDVIVGPHFKGLHPKLAKEGKALAKLTRQLARDTSRVLATHREKVLDRQILHQRLAWTAIEMFGMASVIAKLNSQLEHVNGNREQVERDLIVGKAYCRHAASRCRKRLRGLFRNGDRARLSVADAMLGPVPEATA